MDRSWLDAMTEVLQRSHLFQADEVAAVVHGALAPLGIDCTIHLVDEEQRTLRALPHSGRPAGQPVAVNTSLPGRAFSLVQTLPMARNGGWWVPMVNGTDRLGVVEFVVAGGIEPGDAALRGRCETMAGLIGHLVTVTAPKGDHLVQQRRAQPMTPGAELLTQALPPLTSSTTRLVVSAILEPCYDVGGDGFDYAIDGAQARVAIFDAVGHGLTAAMTCTVTIAAIRAARRAGDDLYAQARAADAVLLEQFSDSRFVTAVLAELDLDTGTLRYINAGHPRPLVLRGGRIVRELRAGRRMPLGLDDPDVEVAEEILEPGDRLLLHTDGVTEARGPGGELFGVERLVGLARRHASDGLPAPETLRRLAHAVLAHQVGPPADDATLLLTEWLPAAAARTVPGRT